MGSCQETADASGRIKIPTNPTTQARQANLKAVTGCAFAQVNLVYWLWGRDSNSQPAG
jgi:hypothetical protein